MSDVKELIPFLFKIRDFHLTYRATPEPDGRFENDAEHSWSITMAAVLLLPYLQEEFGQKIDREKVLIMSLIHDLAEIKTGDTKTWDTAARADKEQKEKKAIAEFFDMLPKNISDDLKKIWQECENQETLEAKIVKSIDRLDPVVHRVATGCGWTRVGDGQDTIESLDQRQLPRHSFSKTLTELFQEIRKIAQTNNLFVK